MIPSCESIDEFSSHGGKIDSVPLTNFSIVEDVDTSEGVEHNFNEENGAENENQGILLPDNKCYYGVISIDFMATTYKLNFLYYSFRR